MTIGSVDVIIRAESLKQNIMENPRGGKGRAIQMAYADACGMKGELAVFSMMQLEPGSQIGFHIHEMDSEIYLMLDGVALASDNGNEETLNAGDMLITKMGEGHGLTNDTAEPVTFLAAIIKH
jgi:mannose-6-phosphate isomerase-like protein (cupin superfamily)